MKKVILILLLLFLLIPPAFSNENNEAYKILEPSGPVLIAPGDFLNIKFKAPEGGICLFDITPYFNNLAMEEASPGIYEAVCYIPNNIRYLSSSNLFINYKSKDGISFSIKYTDAINYLNNPLPVVIKSKSNDYQLRSGPSADYDRVGYLLKDAKFSVNKQIGDWFRLNTYPQNLWVNKNFVDLLKTGAYPAYNILDFIETKDNENFIDVVFRMSYPCAYSVNNYGDAIYVILYNTASNIWETRFDLKNNLIKDINIIESAENYVKIKISLNVKNLWGYDINFEDKKLTLKLRKPPADTTSLKDKIIILDAGHGGPDPGAAGPGGVTEKEVNLAIVLKLKELLTSSGAKVILTRDADNELMPKDSPAAAELQARCDVNTNNNGAIAVSVHNNSSDDEVKRKTASDTDIYFYRPQSKLLADLIAKNIGKALNKDNYFSLQRSFYLIRPTFSPSVLCEITYISNPQEEIKLKDPIFQQNAAMGIFNGIKEYFEKF